MVRLAVTVWQGRKTHNQAAPHPGVPRLMAVRASCLALPRREGAKVPTHSIVLLSLASIGAAMLWTWTTRVQSSFGGCVERGPDEPIETVETHISVLAFQGDRVYKLKKAVSFPFLDLSTRERRLEDCEREVALNRRFAPDIYLGVRAVTGRDGEVIDHVVEMVRLPSERRLSALAGAGHDVGPCIEQLARDVARFHEAAPTGERSMRPRPRCGRGAVGTGNRAGPSVRRKHRPHGNGAVRRVAGSHIPARSRVALRRAHRGLPARDGHGDLLADDIFCLDRDPRRSTVSSSTISSATATCLPTWPSSRWISNSSDAPT